MIVSKKGSMGLVNEITDFLDEYSVYDDDLFSTSIYPHPQGDEWLIRVPGATRGCINIKDGVIEDIKLYEDVCFGKFGCYKKEVMDGIKNFIGREIDLNK